MTEPWAIPHAVMRRLIREIIAADTKKRNGSHSKKKVSKKAFLILHRETERVLKDMFEVGEQIRRAAGKKTLQAGTLLAAQACRALLLRP